MAMAFALMSTKILDKNVSPWTVEVVTPSDLLISKFEEYDKTKSTAPRLRSFNRAKKWISNLLKRQFKVLEAHRLRHIDINLALQHTPNYRDQWVELEWTKTWDIPF